MGICLSLQVVGLTNEGQQLNGLADEGLVIRFVGPEAGPGGMG